MLRPENVEKNINYIGYPMPVHGTEATYRGDRRRLPGMHGHRRGPGPQPLLHQRQRGQDPGSRRGVHGNEGRSMTTPLIYESTHVQRRRRRRGRHAPRAGSALWTWMLVPGTVWMSVFFVSALLLLIALSFGTTDALGNPRFGSTLDNIAGIFNPDLPASVLAQPGLRGCRVGHLPADRLPGRLRHRATRRALQERSDRAARGAVLRQLSGADVRVADAAVRRGHGDDVAAPASGVSASFHILDTPAP